eukprot:Skav232635  [mRNA]  locus=scaffold12:204708:204923:+ [translate_table: standard]
MQKVPARTEAELCSICFEDQDDSEEISRLPCGHEFHKKCVKKWLVSCRMRCPLCNHDLNESSSSPCCEESS